MTPRYSRRMALATIGAGAAVAVAGPAKAAAPAADVDLVDLGTTWANAQAHVEAAALALRRAMDAMPAEFRSEEGDVLGPYVEVAGGRLQSLQAIERYWAARRIPDTGSPRLKEIIARNRLYESRMVARFGAAQARFKAAAEASGFEAAERGWYGARDRVAALEDRLLGAPAETTAGIVVKLKVVVRQAREDRGAGWWPGEEPEWLAALEREVLADAERVAGLR